MMSGQFFETDPSIFLVITPPGDKLTLFEPGPDFNIAGIGTTPVEDQNIVGTRSTFSGNVYNPLITDIPLETVGGGLGKVGGGLQPIEPPSLDDAIGTFNSVSTVTRGLPRNLIDATNFATITQIDYSGFICINSSPGLTNIADDSVLGCLRLQYGGPFVNNPFDGLAPSSIESIIVGGTGAFRGASGYATNINLSNASPGGTGVLKLQVAVGTDAPGCNLAQSLAGVCPETRPPKTKKPKGAKRARRN